MLFKPMFVERTVEIGEPKLETWFGFEIWLEIFFFHYV